MVQYNAYLDRALELQVEKWAKAHRLIREVKMPDGAIVKEADMSRAIVALVREALQGKAPEEAKE